MKFDGRILELEEIDALSRAALDGCPKALPRLVEGHLRLFYRMAKKYRSIMDEDEVVSIMVENVIEKFPVKFDPNRGNFTKYAAWYATAGIQWYLRFRFRVVHFPQREDDKIVSTEQNDEIPEREDYGDLSDVILEEHRNHVKQLIRQKVNRLEPLEREIVRLRFGIGKNGADKEPLTFKEIGSICGYSYEWARKLLYGALTRLEPELSEIERLGDIDQ